MAVAVIKFNKRVRPDNECHWRDEYPCVFGVKGTQTAQVINFEKEKSK